MASGSMTEAKLRRWMQELGPRLIVLSAGICRDRHRVARPFGVKEPTCRRLSPGRIARLLATTAVDMGARGYDRASGYGLVDARAALRALSSSTRRAPAR